ncbi:TonB-dependent receptor [Lacinutrix neustonica]|uniref:TonB-dependent receptor n=1 Tax=Lacinutrix neustonica TaxID=2980107 RepID=A0A9E8SCG4_9FLAO|nr:TonB-dependent receptor [Lacinutrix neustonica]WAC00981.1 TonB-dependent receptor [Lacinutrix neustonica]
MSFLLRNSAQEFTIYGTLVDESNVPVAFASVLLLAEDETIVTGVSSSESGTFLLKDLSANAYTLKITFVGYNEALERFELTQSKNFGTIMLKNNTEALEEVNITSKQPTLKKEADRFIFNVENTALSEGNLLEVLRSTPGVLILDNVITVKNSIPTVYINDRKVNLSAGEITQLLENSPANSIKKVEVITNPPAKYDAESGAVLNIVMSRNLITGYRGNIFTNYTQGVFPRHSAGLNQFYKTNKVNVNLNYSFTKSKINREQDDRINYLENTGALDEQWLTNNNRNTRSNTHNVNLNFDYFIDGKNTLSLSANTLLVPFYDYRIKGLTRVNGNRIFNFNSKNHSEDEKYNLGFDLDFEHRFKNGAQISLNTHFTDYNYARDQKVNSNYFFPNSINNFSTAFNTNSNQDTNILTSQLDYTWPINDSSEFTAGIKTSSITTESAIDHFDFDETSGRFIFDPTNSNAYDYEESIFAGYLSYNKNWEKWNFSGGLRVEQTDVDGLSISDNQKNKQNYFEVFPTLNLSFQASKNANIYTNYKRSISRPSYQLLNPFNFFLNDNTVVTGNPFLKPAFTNKFLLGTGLFDFLTVDVFYQARKDAIFEIPIQDNNNSIIAFTPTNINKSNEYGLDVEFYKNITDRWFLYLANRIANIEERLIVDTAEINQNQWYNYSILSADYSFLKDNSLSANLSLVHIGKNIIGLQRIDARLVSNLSIKKIVFSKKGTVSPAIADLFNTQDSALQRDTELKIIIFLLMMTIAILNLGLVISLEIRL